MSPRLALFFLGALCVAELLLRASQRIDRAVSWCCPCDGHR